MPGETAQGGCCVPLMPLVPSEPHTLSPQMKKFLVKYSWLQLCLDPSNDQRRRWRRRRRRPTAASGASMINDGDGGGGGGGQLQGPLAIPDQIATDVPGPRMTSRGGPPAADRRRRRGGGPAAAPRGTPRTKPRLMLTTSNEAKPRRRARAENEGSTKKSSGKGTYF